MSSLRVDPASAVPVFQQIVDGLRGLIAAGVYLPGELIPSVRQQAIRLLVNPNTVQRAYEELERRGLVESRKGVGMVVVKGGRPAAAKETAGAVAQALADAVTLARAAGMTRRQVDSLYRGAWGGAASKTTDTSDTGDTGDTGDAPPRESRSKTAVVAEGKKP